MTSVEPASMALTNDNVAALLEEMAELHRLDGANPYRVAAYQNAAAMVRRLPASLAEILERDGLRGLEALRGIGISLARKIAQMLRLGRSPALARLRRRHGRIDPLATLPTVGKRLAGRIREALKSDSLEEVFAAAHDGRLARVPGIGRKRVEAIRESLARRLNRAGPSESKSGSVEQPAIADLLAIDQEYRRQASRGTLMTIAPREFNPTRAAWLPILHATRGGRRYRVHYSNTARAHLLGRVRDWVAITCEDKELAGRWTVTTATHGPLRGRRIIRGRERECQEHYRQTATVQLSLPTT